MQADLKALYARAEAAGQTSLARVLACLIAATIDDRVDDLHDHVADFSRAELARRNRERSERN